MKQESVASKMTLFLQVSKQVFQKQNINKLVWLEKLLNSGAMGKEIKVTFEVDYVITTKKYILFTTALSLWFSYSSCTVFVLWL